MKKIILFLTILSSFFAYPSEEHKKTITDHAHAIIEKRNESSQDTTRSVPQVSEMGQENSNNKCYEVLQHLPIYTCVAAGSLCNCEMVTGSCGKLLEYFCWPCSEENICRKCCSKKS